jgi:hypothetical protein
MEIASQKDSVVNELIKKLEPNSHRKQLIDAARAFKSNWITFGEYLTRVASEKLYKEWGHRSFEDYCKMEIRIKKNTAIKLTNAYFFVTQTEPAISKSFETKGVPDLDVVNFLHKAKQDDTCTDEMFEDLKEAAIEKGQSGPTLARRYREMTAPIGAEAAKHNLEQSLALLKRLQQKLQAETDLPEEFDTYLSDIYDFINNRITTEESVVEQPLDEFPS